MRGAAGRQKPSGMRPVISLGLILACTLHCLSASDWPRWRGPTGDGQADPAQKVPEKWSDSEKVVWRTPLRGRGHSSPTVVGDRIFLTTADTAAQEQLVLCLDRESGRELWATVVHRGNIDSGNHR